MMQNAARSSVQTMETLLSKNRLDLTSWHVPFYILATTALELFPKVALSRNRQNGEPIPEIIKEFKRLGHKLDALYSSEVVGDDFLLRAGISKVVKVVDQDQFVYRFDFYQNGSNVPIQVYDMESLRYGFMAGIKSNAGIIAYQFDDLLKLCQLVEKAAIS